MARLVCVNEVSEVVGHVEMTEKHFLQRRTGSLWAAGRMGAVRNQSHRHSVRPNRISHLETDDSALRRG